MNWLKYRNDQFEDYVLCSRIVTSTTFGERDGFFLFFSQCLSLKTDLSYCTIANIIALRSHCSRWSLHSIYYDRLKSNWLRKCRSKSIEEKKMAFFIYNFRLIITSASPSSSQCDLRLIDCTHETMRLIIDLFVSKWTRARRLFFCRSFHQKISLECFCPLLNVITHNNKSNATCEKTKTKSAKFMESNNPFIITLFAKLNALVMGYWFRRPKHLE